MVAGGWWLLVTAARQRSHIADCSHPSGS